MNTFKIAWMLFKNNLKLYKFYLTVLIFTTAIYYNFLALNFNPYFNVVNEQYMAAKVASVLCSIVLFFTAVSFMTHANNFFYKLRYKEVGTYMLMGIQSSKIGRVFAIESFLLGSTSLIIGIPVGILFSKLFFMMLGKAMILNTRIPFYLPPKAISTLILIFAAIILLMGLKNYRMVKKSKLIEIINASKKEQSIPRINWIRGILGVISIVAGYIIAVNILKFSDKFNIDFLSASILGFLLICFGTYFFFGSFLSIILKAFIQNKKFIYKGSRLVSFSNTLFRLGTHYRSLTITAILCSATLASLGTGLALKYYADTNTSIEAPYSISYINQDEKTDNKIKEIINASSHKIVSQNQSHFIIGKTSNINSNVAKTIPCLITSYSEIKKSLSVTKPDSYQSILKDIEPKENETVCILHSNLLFSGNSNEERTIAIQGKAYVLKKEVKLPFIGEISSIGSYDTYIVTDKQYNALKQNEDEMLLQGINITDPENSEELLMEIMKKMKNPSENINAYYGQYLQKYFLIGSVYFLGLVMAFVFMISTFSTIYFKVLSDAVLDREQYGMLMKIGMSKKEISKSIYTQVGIAFVLPALMGSLHSIMAVKALEAFMHYQFTQSILISLSVFIVVMSVFYIFMSKKYKAMVMKGAVSYEANL
ncbi:MAG: FtsX-like permease family protein [Ruminiclostridium sp.]